MATQKNKEIPASKTSAFNARLNAEKKEKKKLKKTSKTSDSNSLEQHSYRCSDGEYEEFGQWADELTETTGRRGRGITRSMIIRGLLSMREEIDEDQLISAIKDNM